MLERIGTGERSIGLGGMRRFGLGDLSVTPAERRIAGPAGPVTLEPRVMQLLVALADPAGEVAPRERLLERCWPDMIVGDDSLNRAVAGLRRVLKDAGSAVEVETVPRVGYRLAGELGAGAIGEAALPPPDSGKVRGMSRRVALAGGGVALAAGIGWLALGRQPRRDPKLEALLANAEQAARQADPDADRQGVGLLREAVAHAPEDAAAWGLLALALRNSAEFAPQPAATRLLSDSRAASTRALALNAGQPDALLAQALLAPTFGNWLEQEQRILALLADSPKHLPGLDRLSFVWAGAGLIRAHYPVRLETVKRDPLHAGYNFRSIYAHWMNGDIAAADRAGERGLELWPGHFATRGARIDIFTFTGRAERALAMLDDETRRPGLPKEMLDLTRTATLAFASGRPADRARAIDVWSKALWNGGPYSAVNASMYLSALGAPERALDATEAYLLERGPLMVATAWQPGQTLHNDLRRRFTNYLFTPAMAEARTLPRFRAIVRDIGLADYWARSGARWERAARRNRLPDFA